MANRFHSPDEQFCDTTGAPYALGTLSFYVTGSSTPLAVYSDATLSTSLGAVVTLDAAGRAGSIFLQNLTYKVVLADASAVQIWSMDPVSTSDVTTTALFTSYAGNPNGNVAGTAASSGVSASVVWDRTNNILYVCTTSGVAAAAVWTAVNSAAQTATPFPQGRLTPTTATPVISADATGVTAVYYTPYNGNLVPVYNGSTMTLLSFAELTLTLTNAAYTANSLFDVFAYSSSGTLALATGPAWTVAGNYVSGAAGSGALTAGTAARGTGAGTTQLTRVLGLWTNTVSMTARNGASTVTIAANQGTYLGTIWIDTAAQAVTCHASYGGIRKFGVWNAYNRVPVTLYAGDSTASWTYATNTLRGSNAANATSLTTTLTTLCGLPEEMLYFRFKQVVQMGGDLTAKIAVGFNSTTAASGVTANFRLGVTANTSTAQTTIEAQFESEPVIGLSSAISLELASAATVTYVGTSASMELIGTWRA